jgi:predicted HTH domain antitoxin
MDTVDFPSNMNEELNILVKKGYYPSKSELLRDAFRVLLNTRSELKISLAIELYLMEKVSISRAAEFAGITTIEFKEIMAGRGIIRVTEGKSAKEMDLKLEKLGII